MQVAQPNRYEKIDFLGEGQVSSDMRLMCESAKHRVHVRFR